MRAVRQDTIHQLRLEQIDASTGKIVPHEEKPPVTIWAVTVHELSEEEKREQRANPVASVFTNTILLRDVPSTVSEEQVLELFHNQLENCPPVLRVNQDVANCW